MKPRRKKVKRLADRNLRGLEITTTSRATDSLASAMKNLELGNREMAMVHLIDVLDYLMETKVVGNEIWRRYTRKKKDDRRKAVELKALKQSPPLPDVHYEQGIAFMLSGAAPKVNEID